MTWLRAMATSERQTQREKDLKDLQLRLRLLQLGRKWDESELCKIYHRGITYGLSYREVAYQCTIVLHKIHGDPKYLQKNFAVRFYSIPYTNPTEGRINIAPMGIIRFVNHSTKIAEFAEFVYPGETIMVPIAYTTGGQFSTVKGVAPQLVPVEKEYDQELDLMPVSYQEWCDYCVPHTTKCCNRFMAWSDMSNTLVCVKCLKAKNV